ncbi:lipopolysaccharide biosynthesis protein [Aquimarina sp. MAR_2010_214]|uniref:lipopolysaccharide biosynthesis protein n=1 Tax=Aquimarina sp. MAR_2010_214 TaxID=1250026 RepID=UPI000C70E2C1|nr:oligosaccharide flippase family protein [Aquimarina sp. MAR_2010_214]
MNRILSYIKKSEYTKHVSTLISGTLLSQGVFFASSIIIARLYTPTELSVFAIFFSITFVISGASSLKYDHAIIIEENDKNTLNILIGSLVLSVIFNTFCLFIVLIFGKSIGALFSMEPSFIKILYFIPAASFLLNAYNCFKNFSNRNRFYKVMAVNKIIDSSSISIGQILLGLLKMSAIGLVFGYIFSKIISLFHFVFKTRKIIFFNDISREQILSQLKSHNRFPKYSLPGETVGTLATHLPVFLIGNFFGGNALGNYSLVERVLNAPSSLVGSAVLDVFKQKASIEYHENGDCKKLYVNTFKILVILGICPSIILFFFGTELFLFVFGEQWRQAGEYTKVLSGLFFFSFCCFSINLYVLYC